MPVAPAPAPNLSPAPAPAPNLSRAAVVRSLAWSAPVVASVVAAPMAAASPWVRHTVAFTRRSVASATGVGQASAQPTGPTDTIAVTSTLVGGRRHLSTNLSTSGGGSALAIASVGASYTSAQAVSLTFPAPVRDLHFVLGGIDKNQNEGSKGFADEVTVSPEPQVLGRTGVVGAGTRTSPLTAAVDGIAGTATVTIAGPVTSVTITLGNVSGKNGTGEQAMTLSDVSYLGDLHQY